jgi:hypothetical protein
MRPLPVNRNRAKARKINIALLNHAIGLPGANWPLASDRHGALSALPRLSVLDLGSSRLLSVTLRR